METKIQHAPSEMYKSTFPPHVNLYAKDTAKKTEIIYPDSDGEPMGETGSHVRASMHLYGALRQFYLNKTDIYIAADMFMYYEKGNPRACKAPDVMVIKGVPNHYERRSFKLWEEKAGPCVIFEISSRSTMIDDLVTKSNLYAALGVCEYYLFDPLREFLEEGLTGFRLADKKYIQLLPDSHGRLHSEELALNLVSEGEILRLLDPQTDAPIPSYSEALMLWDKEKQRAEQEKQQKEAIRRQLAKEREQTQKLLAQLKASGIEPDMGTLT